MSMASMEKHLFNLKFAAKELERNSKKCDKEEKAEKAKLKKQLKRGIWRKVNNDTINISNTMLRLPRSMLRMPSDRRTSPSTS